MSRIVVGIDGSAEAKRALRWAVDEARLRDAELNVVHVPAFPHIASGLAIEQGSSWRRAGGSWCCRIDRAHQLLTPSLGRSRCGAEWGQE